MTSMNYETFKKQQKLGLKFADLYYLPGHADKPVSKHTTPTHGPEPIAEASDE